LLHETAQRLPKAKHYIFFLLIGCQKQPVADAVQLPGRVRIAAPLWRIEALLLTKPGAYFIKTRRTWLPVSPGMALLYSPFFGGCFQVPTRIL
jgi:hypothetical protein